MKQKLRDWLNIKDPETPEEPESIDYVELAEKISEKVKRDIRSIIANMGAKSCYVCKKGLVAGRDAIYTNFEGYAFCSHDCIDKNKDRKDKN